VGIVFAVVELLMFIIFPNWAAAAACRKVGREAGQVPIADLLDPLLCGIFQTRLIIGFAMLEGAAFLQAIAYMVEGQLFSLAIGLALVLVMAMAFPTRSRLENWIERRKGVIMQEPAFTADSGGLP
jgi:hypothetical protein